MSRQRAALRLSLNALTGAAVLGALLRQRSWRLLVPLVNRLRGAGFRDVSTHVYGGARHEVLNETNREEVIANLIAWIRRAVG